MQRIFQWDSCSCKNFCPYIKHSKKSLQLKKIGCVWKDDCIYCSFVSKCSRALISVQTRLSFTLPFRFGFMGQTRVNSSMYSIFSQPWHDQLWQAGKSSTCYQYHCRGQTVLQFLEPYILAMFLWMCWSEMVPAYDSHWWITTLW